jgi:hypothetical protein
MRPRLHPVDKERLIQLVVQEVMAAIQKGNGATPAKGVPEANKVIRCSDRLITGLKVQALAKDGCKQLVIGPACIVTPSAIDLLHELGVTLERGARTLDSAAVGQSQKNVALVSRFLFKIQWQAVHTALNASKWNGVLLTVPTGARDLEPQLALISNGIKKKELDAAIILDDHVNLLYTRLQRRDGLMPVIGWSAESVAGQKVSPQANVLLLNNRAFGTRKLQELITVWLSTGRSE